jgi:VTC domain
MQVATASGADIGLERELKFVVPEARAASMLAFLQALCRPDGRHATGLVSTIYYDTPWLQLLGEKVDSDYQKLKVRLRWYRGPATEAGSPGSFLEIKRRIGTFRDKVRRDTPLMADALDRMTLEDPALLSVVDLIPSLGVPVPMPLLPALLLRYRRYRFIEPVSGTRVSLDTDITAVCGRRGLFGGGAGAGLRTAVLEVKGQAEDLPRALRPLAHLGAHRASFSKYSVAARAMR